jgi:hypothetical protein
MMRTARLAAHRSRFGRARGAGARGVRHRDSEPEPFVPMQVATLAEFSEVRVRVRDESRIGTVQYSPTVALTGRSMSPRGYRSGWARADTLEDPR